MLCSLPTSFTTGNGTVAVCNNFAVCSKSGTQQKSVLPCASREPHGTKQAHGKDTLRCVPNKKAHGKNVIHGKHTLFVVCHSVRAHNKESFHVAGPWCTFFRSGSRNAVIWLTAKKPFADHSLPCVTLPCVNRPLPWHTANVVCPLLGEVWGLRCAGIFTPFFLSII